MATERLAEARRLYGELWPSVTLPARLAATAAAREDVAREWVRGRLEVSGPVTAREVATALQLTEAEVDAALVALEAQGFVLRGRFTPFVQAREWCERRLLARIHRLTLQRLRAEIEPVSVSEYLRFLLRWQRLAPGFQVRHADGLFAAIEGLDGFEAPAGAWETEILARRCVDYDPWWLDALCQAGRVGWGRLRPMAPSAEQHAWRWAAVAPAPMTLFVREHLAAHLALARPRPDVSAVARRLLEVLERRGALFLAEWTRAAGLLPAQVESALGELVAAGWVTADGFAGLRALIIPPHRREMSGRRGHRRVAAGGALPSALDAAGRWSVLASPSDADRESALELRTGVLLRRYGILCRALLGRESEPPPWRDVVRVLRLWEARGVVRGGRFVAGLAGEQYALPEAIAMLRSARREPHAGELVVASAADPVNLVGILTPGRRVAALRANRIAFVDGVPVAAAEAGAFVPLALAQAEVEESAVRAALLGGPRTRRERAASAGWLHAAD